MDGTGINKEKLIRDKLNTHNRGEFLKEDTIKFI